MTETWMIDVLTDLRRFANENQMARLADKLDDTINVAAGEVARHAGGMQRAEYCAEEIGDVLRSPVAVQHA